MKKRAIAFDLDGTLLDTLGDIASSMNTTLEAMGLPTHPIDRYKIFVGNGMKKLVERALPPERRDPETQARCLSTMSEIYLAHHLDTTRPYPGVAELLDGLSAAGVRLTILSNKPDALTKSCVDGLLSAWRFAEVHGARDGIAKKPDPAALLAIVDRSQLPKDQWLYVGDTNTDMQTGLAAGLHTVGVSWGFRDRAELLQAGAHQVIDDPLALLELI
jgi:phosphoglycolate phosphatase